MNVGYRQSLNVDMAGESVMEDPYANLAQIWHGEGGIVHSRCQSGGHPDVQRLAATWPVLNFVRR